MMVTEAQSAGLAERVAAVEATPLAINARESGLHLEWIDGLRGLAVIVVLLFHAAIWSASSGTTAKYLSLGRMGVDLFLVLSGFCLSWPHYKRECPSALVAPLNLSQYARRRIRRILPPYLVALTGAVGASYFVYNLGGPSWWREPFQNCFPLQGWDSTGNLLTHIMLIHGLVERYSHSVDGAFWSLSLEWQFYFLFPALLWAARRWSPWIACGSVILTTLLFRSAIKAIDDTLVQRPLWNESALARWAEFALGVIAAGLISGRLRLPPHLARCLQCGPIVALITCAVVALSLRRANFFLLPVVWGAYCTVVVVYGKSENTHFRRMINSKLLAATGRISYSLYLTHGSVFMLMTILPSRWNWSSNLRTLWYFALGVPLSYAVAYLLFLSVERPLLKHRGGRGGR